MQSMFKTINISPIQSKEESIQGSQLPNPSDFSTMQNLFTTQKLDMSKMPKMNQNPDALADIQNINNINMNDFNTMQSLFKTNANVEKIQKP